MGVSYRAISLLGMKVDFPLFGRETPVEGYDPDAETFHGYPVITGTYMERGGTDSYIALLVADGTSSNGDPDCMLAIPAGLDGRSREFAAKMEAAGVWNAGLFGLWAVLYCSY